MKKSLVVMSLVFMLSCSQQAFGMLAWITGSEKEPEKVQTKFQAWVLESLDDMSPELVVAYLARIYVKEPVCVQATVGLMSTLGTKLNKGAQDIADIIQAIKDQKIDLKRKENQAFAKALLKVQIELMTDAQFKIFEKSIIRILHAALVKEEK